LSASLTKPSLLTNGHLKIAAKIKEKIVAQGQNGWKALLFYACQVLTVDWSD